MKEKKTPAEFITPRDLDECFGIPESTQRLFRARGDFVPHYRVGRRVMYRRAEVAQWVEDRRQESGEAAEKPKLLTLDEVARLLEKRRSELGLTPEQVNRVVAMLIGPADVEARVTTAGGYR